MRKKRLVIKQTNPWGVLLIVLFALAFLVGIALLAFSKTIPKNGVKFSSYDGFISYTVPNTKLLKQQLRVYGLCSNYSGSVEPYLLKSFPKDFLKYSARDRKRMFIAAMLPIALVVKQKFDKEHQMILEIIKKKNNGISLDRDERNFLQASIKKYKTGDLKKLSRRVDSIPVSLLIAQAGIESGWGKSRFTYRYNNIYGLHRRNRKTYQSIVQPFKSLYDATLAYSMNLNISNAYKKFREVRYLMGNSKNPYKLAEYLTMYSVKRDRYIRLVQNIILSNKLTKYDHYSVKQMIASNPHNLD